MSFQRLIRYRPLWKILFRAWALLLVYFTARPGKPDEVTAMVGWIRLDYLEHFILYMALPVLWQLGSGPFPKAKNSYAILAFLIVFGIVTEVYQFVIPYRNFNIADLLLNTAGILCGLWIGKIFHKLFFST